MNVVWWLLGRFVAGFIARAVVPGRDPMGWLRTLILGLIGSLVAGFLGDVLISGDRDFSPAGLVGSIIGAVAALLIWRAVSRNRMMGSGTTYRRAT